MIRVYYLPVEQLYDTEQVAGIILIHDAILDCTEAPDVRKLIMDTNEQENISLSLLSINVREPTQEELALYNSTVVITPPNPDIIRAAELLSTSPSVITQPQMWELMRIYGRLHGIP